MYCYCVLHNRVDLHHHARSNHNQALCGYRCGRGPCALAPFRQAFTRPADDPAALPYLNSQANQQHGAIDIELEVWLQTAQMRAVGDAGVRLTAANYRDAYWTAAQLVAHHSVNGCNLRSGDVLGTGTQSGPYRDDRHPKIVELDCQKSAFGDRRQPQRWSRPTRKVEPKI